MQRCTSCLNGSLSIIIATIKLPGDHQRSAAHALASRASPSTKPRCWHEKTAAKPRNSRASTNAYKQVVELRSMPNHRVNPPGAPGAARGWRMFQLACWARSTAHQLMKLPPARRPCSTYTLLVFCGQGRCGQHARCRRARGPTNAPFPIANRRSRARHSLTLTHTRFFSGFLRILRDHL